MRGYLETGRTPVVLLSFRLFIGALALLPLTFCVRTRLLPVTIAADTAQRLIDYSVAIGYGAGTELRGTGMLIPKKGMILTNEHILGADTRCKISLDGIQFYDAFVTARHSDLDLIVLKIETDASAPPPSMQWPEIHEQVRPGLPVVAFGSAFGLHQTYMQGFVSHPERRGLRGQPDSTYYIQMQGITYPGMSGAPVFDLEGQWLGINRAAYGYSTTTGTGLVIPARIIVDWLDSLPLSPSHDAQ